MDLFDSGAQGLMTMDEELACVPTGSSPDPGVIPDTLDDLVNWLDIKPTFDQGVRHFTTFGLAGDDRPAVTSEIKPQAADLLTAIDNGNDVLTWGLDDISLGDMLGSNMDPMSDASLDSFVDLSSYLMENTISAIDDIGDPAAAVTETATSPKKRSFEEVETVELVDVEDEVVMATTSDHDYVSKKPRLSSLSEASDTGSTNMDTTFSAPVTPDMKYRHRRNKNNVASKRSREIRKQKYSEMDMKSEQLKAENEKLRTKIVELEKLAKEMKSILVAKLAGR